MKKILIAALRASAIALCALFISCGKKIMDSQTQYVFGTVCTVNLYADGSEELYAEVFKTLNGIDDKFNVNKEYSDISKVNQNAGSGNAVSVSQEVFEVMKVAKKVAKASENSFNPALGKLIRLWGIGTENARIPSEDEIADALKHCNPESIVLSQNDGKYFIEITDRETQIDLGAIVKGYGADQLAAMLESRGVKKALIDLGGNIYVFGNKSQNPDDLWRVAIRNPVNPDAEPVEVVSLKEGSVVTSGNYERYFEKDGIRYHHLLDGNTGYPAQTGLASVSVIGKQSMYCDALATAFFVAGKSGDILDKLDILEIKKIFVALNGKIVIK